MSARSVRSLAAVLALLALPALALAEVSVELRRDGTLRRVVYLTRLKGHHPTVWRQLRGYVPAELLLNALGDNLGDLAPTIVTHPATGYPWVVWSRNLANQKRIAVASWTGKAWTAPTLVVPDPGPMYRDQLDPALIFDAAGVPYLVWWQPESKAKIYFSTLIHGTWAPPLLISDEATDSRRPTLVLSGTNLSISYTTPSGAVTKTRPTGVLVESAASLMDSPIPPGNTSSGGSGGGAPPDGDSRLIKK